jgi:hypothetical protein
MKSKSGSRFETCERVQRQGSRDLNIMMLFKLIVNGFEDGVLHLALLAFWTRPFSDIPDLLQSSGDDTSQLGQLKRHNSSHWRA